MELQLAKAQQKGNELIYNLTSKCWEDESFKKELIANPIRTIENFIGKPLNIPKGTEIIVTELTDDDYVYYALPANPMKEDLELSEQQLELVAGGGTPFYIAGCAIFMAGVAIGNCL